MGQAVRVQGVQGVGVQGVRCRGYRGAGGWGGDTGGGNAGGRGAWGGGAGVEGNIDCWMSILMHFSLAVQLSQNTAHYDPMFGNVSFGLRDTTLPSNATPQTADDWEVPPSDIIMDQLLGEGAFGKVYKGFLRGPVTCSKVKPNYRNAVHVNVAIKLLKGWFPDNTCL